MRICLLLRDNRIDWLSDLTATSDQTGDLSRLLAWFFLAVAAIALIVAIYLTFRTLMIRESQKESDLEFEADDGGEYSGPNRFPND